MGVEYEVQIAAAQGLQGVVDALAGLFERQTQTWSLPRPLLPLWWLVTIVKT